MGMQTDIPRDNKVRKARLSIEQYYRICDSGALEEFGKTELIEGEICVVNAQYAPHMETKVAIMVAFVDLVRTIDLELKIGIEGAIELGNASAPEPDIFLYHPVETQAGIPQTAVRLVVEVADATVAYDLGRKKRLYAAAAIPEYWVALVRKRKIERFSDPIDGTYQTHDSFDFADRVDSVTLPGVYLPADTLG